MTPHPLKTWRESKGFSQQKAASHLAVSRWTINQIEVRRYAPHWKLCKRLSEATGVPLHEFNSDIFEPPQHNGSISNPEPAAAGSDRQSREAVDG